MKRISIVLAFMALMTIAAVGQGPGPMGMGPGGPGPGMGMGPHQGPVFITRSGNAMFGAWWKNSEVVKELQLTDAQVKQIEQTFLDYRLKLIDLRADLERQETKLEPLLEADQPSEQQVGPQVDAVVAARGRLEKTNTMMMLAIRRVLSVDQWKKMQTIEHRRRERRMYDGRGPGGQDEHFRGPRRDDGPRPQSDAPQAPAPPEAPGESGDK